MTRHARVRVCSGQPNGPMAWRWAANPMTHSDTRLTTMHRIGFRKKMFLKAFLMSACLFEAVGCPQIFADAMQAGFRDFILVGVPAALLAALDLESLLPDLTTP